MKDAAQREHAVREMVERIPQFAPAWKEFASLCDDEGERLAAIENGLAANPDAGTKGMLKINKALALNLKGSTTTPSGCWASWPSIPTRRWGRSTQQRL